MNSEGVNIYLYFAKYRRHKQKAQKTRQKDTHILKIR